VRSHFFTLTVPFLRALGSNPSSVQVGATIDAIVQLFRALMQPPRNSIQGLWAELYLITQARDSKAMVAAWHATPDERYDFAVGNQRIEVKCALGRERRHHFSLEQLTPPQGGGVYVASVCTEPSGGGTSIADFLNALRPQLKNDAPLQLRLESMVSNTLGRVFVEGLSTSFDLELADQTLGYYPVDSIPRPPGPMPFEVTNVQFVANVGRVPAVPLGELIRGGGLFEAVVRSDFTN